MSIFSNHSLRHKISLIAIYIAAWLATGCQQNKMNRRFGFSPDYADGIASLVHYKNRVKSIYITAGELNKLKYIPQSITSIKNLEINIDIPFNPDTILEKFKNNKLESITIKSNHSFTMPTNLGLFPNLKVLDFENVQIHSTPFCLTDLKKLDTFRIESHSSYNFTPLDTFPRAIFEMKRLKLLIWQYPFKNLPKNIEGTPNYDWIFLEHKCAPMLGPDFVSKTRETYFYFRFWD